MAKLAKPGDVIKGYRITAVLNKGAMAAAYAAVSPRGEKVFFKQYKSPSVTVDWYRGYVAYQQELKRRVETTPLGNFTYRMIEFFEEDFGPRTFFQVFEFVKGGLDLEKVLEDMQRRPTAGTWDQAVILSKIMMNAVATLHDARIVHCDLKPANIQLFPDSTIAAGYQLKLIDMDFSVLADRRAPWDGQSAYVGSPHYFSPEHLRGEVPVPASDVFTCGLMLYELLSGQHPYGGDDDESYARGVLDYEVKRPRLFGAFAAPATSEQVAEALYRCLSPDAATRPTARNVNLILNGRGALGPLPASPPGAPAGRRPALAHAVPRPPSRSEGPLHPAASGHREAVAVPALELTGESGQRISMRIRTEVGRMLCRQFGEDAKYCDAVQFVLDRRNNCWVVAPNLEATNETLLNGRAITVETPLAEGDVLAVGREAKGIVKLPLVVHLG